VIRYSNVLRPPRLRDVLLARAQQYSNPPFVARCTRMANRGEMRKTFSWNRNSLMNWFTSLFGFFSSQRDRQSGPLALSRAHTTDRRPRYIDPFWVACFSIHVCVRVRPSSFSFFSFSFFVSLFSETSPCWLFVSLSATWSFYNQSIILIRLRTSPFRVPLSGSSLTLQHFETTEYIYTHTTPTRTQC